jgi:hypothetical protein
MSQKIQQKSKNHSSMTIWTNLVETHPMHIRTKFEENPATSFGEEVKSIILTCINTAFRIDMYAYWQIRKLKNS